jgi:hypothetical protein
MAARMLLALSACLAAVVITGCATAKKDTTGFAVQQEVVLDLPYPEAWQHVKHTLVAQEFELYTRDKRGVFIAYTGGKRLLGFNRPRTQYTLELDSLSSAQTKVTIEAVKQKYGTSLTTYPDWHDRPTEADEDLHSLVAALNGEVSPEAVAAAAVEAVEADSLEEEAAAAEEAPQVEVTALEAEEAAAL